MAIIIIPDSLSRDGFLHCGKSEGIEKCKVMSVYGNSEDVSSDDIEEISTNVIVKACFHPFNSSAIAILRQSKWLKVINVSQYETHTISLDDKVRFSSCCFGPRMLDFSSLSLFLLATSGAVYFVSPIIPRGPRLLYVYMYACVIARYVCMYVCMYVFMVDRYSSVWRNSPGVMVCGRGDETISQQRGRGVFESGGVVPAELVASLGNELR